MGVEMDIQKNFHGFRLNVKLHSSGKRIGILGASGSGKSLTLQSLAGIVRPDSGLIARNGTVVYDSGKRVNLPPAKRNIGYMFQNYALFPNMTVAGNICTGCQSETKVMREQIVQSMIQAFSLTGLEKHFPNQLSGGQQQRVALARIMANHPAVLLLDEPFSALDTFLKDQLQEELSVFLKNYDGTVIFVSHNRDEIYRFCEELYIMDCGEIIESGKTEALFRNPKYRKTAVLTGCTNFSRTVWINEHTVEAVDWNVRLSLNHTHEKCDVLGYRSEDFVPIYGQRQANCILFRMTDMTQLPQENIYRFAAGERNEYFSWTIRKKDTAFIQEKGMPNYLQIQEEHLLFLR